MIQELLGGASLIGGGGGERKISILETPPSSTSSPSFSPSTTTSTTTNTTPANPSAPEHLRCPRCDSSNTKFCYYNNYNLTQPRHFCKTCRRYWTKGGALRNVPIGGGCRKNKNTTVSSSVGKSNGSNNKMRTMVSEIGRSGGFGNNGFDHHEFASSPIFWASSAPQNSHLLNLLRATGHNPNPNPNPESNNSFGVKDEGCLVGNLNHLNMTAEPTSGGLNGRTGLGFDPLAHVPSLGLCSPLWKNSQQNGVIVGEAQNSGIQELYQRLKSSSSSNNNGNYYSENLNTPLMLSNVGSSSSSSSNILESSPVAGSELGFWNPTFSWSDLPTTNGAYP